MARASRVFTCRPQPAAHSVQVLAYQVGIPGTWSSDWTRYGISFSTLAVEQPESAAVPAPVTPSTVRNRRRSMADEGSGFKVPGSGGPCPLSPDPGSLVVTRRTVTIDPPRQMA